MHKKTLCLGGSFNPIHHGHLLCARFIAEISGFARILLIPSGQPPHKQDSDIAGASDRLQMCRLAIEHQYSEAKVSFEVSDLEITRPGPSFTIDTVRQLKHQGWAEVHWLIGADMLNFLPNWREPAALVSEANFLIMERPGHPIVWDRLPPFLAHLQKNVVPAPQIDISSTDIRRRVREGLSIDYLTPPGVVDYIRGKTLYR